MPRHSIFGIAAIAIFASAGGAPGQTTFPNSSECSPVQAELVEVKDQSAVFVVRGQAYEVLTGNRAFNHLSSKRLRNPERFAGMGGALAARGYRPTDVIVVERSLGPARIAIPGYRGSDSPETELAGVTYNNWQGEQIFWSWDDGDDATWEGSQYVERTVNPAWVAYDGQIDISNTNGTAIWGVQTGGGGPISLPGMPDGIKPHFAQYSFAQHLDRDFQEWAVCMMGGCMGCAAGCLFTGPAYPGCYGSCCFGVSIACAIEYYFGP